MKPSARCFLVSCLSLSLTSAAVHAVEADAAAPDSQPAKEESGGKKEKKHKDGDKKKDGEKKHKDGDKKKDGEKHKDGDKKKDGEKHKDGKKKDKDGKKKDKDGKKKKDKDGKKKKHHDDAALVNADGTAVPVTAPAVDAKGAAVESDALASQAPQTWCEWLQNDPGKFKPEHENPWFQSFQIGGRFHYQAAYLEGTDVNGLHYNDHYDEFRRLRLETKTKFLKYFTAEVNVNLVSDDRFKDDFYSDLEWGYDRFDEATLQFDLGKAIGPNWFDEIKLTYGRMKLKMTEEQHMSSDESYTIERSGVSDKLAGAQSRPTGFTVDLEKDDFALTLGVFSAEDDADFVGGWNDGEFFYGSLTWKPNKEFKLVLDYTQNNLDDRPVVDDALGYAWAASLSAVYEQKRWGVIAEAVYGDNGGANGLIQRRQGDFHGFVLMPWVWIVEDKLQAVVELQYASSPESQGWQIPSRYVRADHDNPAVDVDNGRGNEHHYVYAGLNYHICKDRIKLMGGVSWEQLTTRKSEIEATTYQMAFRTAF